MYDKLKSFRYDRLVRNRYKHLEYKYDLDTQELRIGKFLAGHEHLSREAFETGIDSPLNETSVSKTSMGPHLLTTKTAIDMQKDGLVFTWLSSRVGAGDQYGITPNIRCPFKRRLDCDKTNRYRTIDGSCNNLDNSIWGRAATPFERLTNYFMKPSYDDLNNPRSKGFKGGKLQNTRLLSTNFFLPHSNTSSLSYLAMEYGQFLSNDLQFTAVTRGYAGSTLDCCRQPKRPSCMPIDIPPDDPYFTNRTCINFVRSIGMPKLKCILGTRQQLNQYTHYHDGSQVYGSETNTAHSLREFTGGLMRTSAGNLLPKDKANIAGCILSKQNRHCFRSGDVRTNQQPALISMHTVWMREHNKLAAELSRLNPSWADERLYQEARRIVIAMMQHITYGEYLPLILGNASMEMYGLKPLSRGYFKGYNRNERPMIRNAFATAAFRFGHSMIGDRLLTHDGSTVTSNNYLKHVFLRPDLVYDHGVDEILRGLTRYRSEKTDRYATTQVTRHLFETGPGHGADLMAIDIQRGRDHGLPSYRSFRWRYCGLDGNSFHTPEMLTTLRKLYGNDEEFELLPAGVSETPNSGGQVGPTFACIIGEQFRALKTGDRFYYENNGRTGFTLAQLNSIRRITLAKVFCRNTGITSIQQSAMKTIQRGNEIVDCDSLPDIDLTHWGCVPVNGGWTPWQKTSCFLNWRLNYTTCTNPTPNKCGRPCSYKPYQVHVVACQTTSTGIVKLPQSDLASEGSSSVSLRPSEQLIEAILSSMTAAGQKGFDSNVFEKVMAEVTKVKPDVGKKSPSSNSNNSPGV